MDGVRSDGVEVISYQVPSETLCSPIDAHKTRSEDLQVGLDLQFLADI